MRSWKAEVKVPSRAVEMTEAKALGMAYAAEVVLSHLEAKKFTISDSRGPIFSCRAPKWTEANFCHIVETVHSTPTLPPGEITKEFLMDIEPHLQFRDYLVLVRGDKSPFQPSLCQEGTNPLSPHLTHRFLHFNDPAFLVGFKKVCDWYEKDWTEYLQILLRPELKVEPQINHE
jgi:hypothetical protein